MRAVLLTTFLLGCSGGGGARVEKTETNPEIPLGCGDGEQTAGEACDDGNHFGGDGCTERCAVETGLLEVEPNDTWDQSTDWDLTLAHGALPEGDVDCWRIDAPKCSSILAGLMAPCFADTVLTLHEPDGTAVATGTAGPDGCAVLDPFVAPGATSVPAGPHALCVSSLVGRSIPSYALSAEIDPSGAGFPLPVDGDLDGDGSPDRCDEDVDGDGVLNDVDNCVGIANGPGMAPLEPSADGFIRSWLTVGPVTGTANDVECRPSLDQSLGDDANAAPELADAVGGLVWIAWFDADDHINLRTEYGTVDAPREAYAHVYVSSATQRDVQLALGADDGVFSWLNGVQIHDESRCTGANVDDYLEPVTLLAGWNRLTVKVRDHGGGWGLYARFLTAGGAPITNLELSLTAAGPWLDDQSDGDGDGLGDACDPTP